MTWTAPALQKHVPFLTRRCDKDRMNLLWRVDRVNARGEEMMVYAFLPRCSLRKTSPMPVKKKPKLQQLLAKVTLENRHAEVDWGKPKGNEAW
jgi:hypothetical protein